MPNSQFDIPILLLIYNRPELALQVMLTVREIQPCRLFIAADGPNHLMHDQALCMETRKQVMAQIDWPCEVHTLFRDSNEGCRWAVTNAVNWFFQHVEMGIVLEDDILPNHSFFFFCRENLLHYQHDPRIMMVSGFNHLGTWHKQDCDLFFSQIGCIWGWATWKRAWELNKSQLDNWPQIKRDKLLYRMMPTAKQAAYRHIVTQQTFNGRIDTWDYIWSLNRIVNHGVSVVPSRNLIKNIGFGQRGTHNSFKNSRFDTIVRHDTPLSQPLRYPSSISIDHEFDRRVFSEFTYPSIKKLLPHTIRPLGIDLFRKIWRNIILRTKMGFKSSTFRTQNTHKP